MHDLVTRPPTTMGGESSLSGTSTDGESGAGFDFPNPIGFWAQITAFQSGIDTPTEPPVLTGDSVGGSMVDGTYQVAYSFTHPAGETGLSPVVSTTLTGGTSTQAISVNSITLPTGASGINFYVSSTVNGLVLTQQNSVAHTSGSYSITTPGQFDSAPLVNTTAGYSFLQYEGGRTGWTVRPGGFAGTAGGQITAPAREVNGRDDVPIGAMVWVQLSEIGQYWWFSYDGPAAVAGGTACPQGQAIVVTATATDDYGQMLGYLLTLDPTCRWWVVGSPVMVVDANNLTNPQVPRPRVYTNAVLIDSFMGFCVYSVSCCDTPAVLVPTPTPPTTGTVTGGTVTLSDGTVVVVSSGTVLLPGGSSVGGGLAFGTCTTDSLTVTGVVPVTQSTQITSGTLVVGTSSLTITSGTVTASAGVITGTTVNAVLSSGPVPAIGATITSGSLTLSTGDVLFVSTGTVTNTNSATVSVVGGTFIGGTLTGIGSSVVCQSSSPVTTYCDNAPYTLAVTLLGFGGGGSIPTPSSCPSCTDTPTSWSLPATGFSGSLDALNFGTVDLTLPPNPLTSSCQWSYPRPGGGGASIYTNGTTVTLNMAVRGAIAVYTGTISGTDCSSQVELTESQTTGAGGEYPGTLIITPTVVVTPTDGCEQANLGSILLSANGDDLWQRSANGVDVEGRYDGIKWGLQVTTDGGCFAYYSGPGDCCLMGGVVLTALVFPTTHPPTLLLTAASNCNNAPGPPIVPVVPGTEECVSCPGELWAGTLTLKFVQPGSCIDGLNIPLVNVGPNLWNLPSADYQVPGATCCGDTVITVYNFTLSCSGIDLTGLTLTFQKTSGDPPQVKTAEMSSDCSLPDLSFLGFTISGWDDLSCDAGTFDVEIL